ncbi:hypothetical protein Tco_1392774 [Tanacetum coccineum]
MRRVFCDLHESDDDVDVENGYDETTTLFVSKSLGRASILSKQVSVNEISSLKKESWNGGKWLLVRMYNSFEVVLETDGEIVCLSASTYRNLNLAWFLNETAPQVKPPKEGQTPNATLRMERLNLGNSPTANIKGKGDVIHIWKRV